MKTTIEKTALLRVLGHAQAIVERRNTIPILSNVMIRTEGDALVVSATDLDIMVRERVAATVSAPGATTVSAHLLFDVVRKMPEGPISISEANGRMTILAGRATFALPTLPVDQFPELAIGTMAASFAVPAKELSRILEGARFAMSTEDTRYYLNGIYLHVDPTPGGAARIRAVATDGHRLSLVSALAPAVEGEMPNVIVHRKTVSEIAKVVADFDGDVEVSISPSKIRFAIGELVYVSKVVDGTFPDYERVVPRRNTKLLVVDADRLAEGIDRVSTIATERTRAVKIGIQRDRLVLSVTSPEHGTATEEVEASYGDEAMEIGFNSRYLLDILAQHRRGTIEILLADGALPALIRRQGEENDIQVLMPMRT